MMATINFKQLAETAESTQTQEAMDALWRAVLSLEKWHFVARGPQEQPVPFSAIVNGKPFLMAFTSPDGARAFALRNKLDQEGQVSLLSIPSKSISYFTAFASQGVFGILFNDHEKGFFARRVQKLIRTQVAGFPGVKSFKVGRDLANSAARGR